MKNLLLTALLVLVFQYTQAQSDSTSTSSTGKEVIIEMNDGSEFRGTLVKRNDQIILLLTENGEMRLNADKVKSIDEVTEKKKKSGEICKPTSYFIGPTGIPLEKGTGYYQNSMLVANLGHFAITKNITIGGGFELISFAVGSPIWFFTPRTSFKLSDKFYAGAGVYMAGFIDEGTFGLGYGVLTYGSVDGNISLGGGMGWSNGSTSQSPLITFSGYKLLGNRGMGLMMENHILPDEGYFGIVGARTRSPGSVFDFGFALLGTSVPPFPYLSYSKYF